MPVPELPGFLRAEPLYRNDRMIWVRAVRAGDGARVVLKSVVPGTTDPWARQRLGHEALILGQLRVPGVVRSHGVVLTGLGPTLVLDDVGTSTPVPPGGVPLLDALRDVSQLARTVAGLHAAGVCHRDVRPTHVVRDPQTNALTLIGFGLATRLTRTTSEAVPLSRLEGTLGYLSPEQSGRMNRAVDWRTDLYSIGVTLYELLVGRRPFESADPAELLHATVARLPRPPHVLRPGMPAVVSRIVLRLLAKDAEDRYQNALALAADLDHCCTELLGRGAIEPFEIGSGDRRQAFSLPARLYGRDAALGRLDAALERSYAGESVFVSICGPAGIGKTALCRELQRRVGEGGLMASGVSNPTDGSPYAPIVQILRSIRRSVAHGPRDRWAFHQERLLRAVGGDGALLLRLVPELRPMLGGEPDGGDVALSDARERMLAMLVRLLRGYHDAETPFVALFDDLQWADPGTLDVLERLITADPRGGPLVVLAWREEAGVAAPGLKRLGASPVEVLRLGPLDLADVGELVAQALGRSTSDVGELALAVREKTSGHPFFVRELLARLATDAIVSFDPMAQRWEWSMERVLAVPPAGDVVELLAQVLAQLPERVRGVLRVAASVGRRFDLAAVATVARVDLAEACRRILSAIQAGVVTAPANVLLVVEVTAADERRGTAAAGAGVEPLILSFVHDEVVRAALGPVPTWEQAAVRVAVGRVLLHRWHVSGGSPFPAADLLRDAPPSQDPAERRLIAEVAMVAGGQAADALAFPTAMRYFQSGVRALGADGWERSHDLAFELHLRAAEASRMCPLDTRSIDFVAEAMRGTTDVLQRTALQRVRMLDHAARYEFDVALNLTLEALSWVDVRLPRGANLGHVALAVARTTWHVRGMTLERLRALPENRNPRVARAMELLADAASVTYYSDPLLLPILLCRMVDLSLEHGVSGTTAFGCAGWAFLQVVTRNSLRGAQLWGAFARELVYRFNDRRMAPKVELMVIGFVDALTQPLASLVAPFQRAGQAARAVGDAEYAALCAMNQLNFSLIGGVDLAEVGRRGEAALAVCREMGQEMPTNASLLTMQFVDCVSGRAPDRLVLKGAHADEARMTERMRVCGDKSGMATLLLHRAHLCVLFGDAAQAVAAVVAAGPALADWPGAPQVPPFLLHSGLAWIRQMRETGRVGGAPLRAARRVHRKLAAMALQAPLNHAHKARLLEAELLDLRGDVAAAQLVYEEAVGLARASGMLHEEALCLERAAQAAHRFGNTRLAGVLGREARSAWEGWGAGACVAALDASGIAPEHGVVGGVRAGLPEFDSVLRAAQAVAGEIQLQELLRKLMHIILENAGATWGMLVLNVGWRLLVAARAEAAESGSIAVLVHADRRPVSQERPLADRVVRDVARTGEAIVVHDGASDTRYYAEALNPPRSALCVPVRKGSVLVGVMYLENEVARSAFNVARSDVVGVLCAQAAAAIENASLYEDLQAAHERLGQVSRQLVDAQEAERRAVARELHDETGQVLTALALQLDLASAPDPSGDSLSTLRGAREIVGDLIQRVRRISLDLRPVMLDDLGLLPALLWLIDRYSEHTGLRVEFVHAGLDRRFPAAIETAAFRIVQEALTNVARHAAVNAAMVSVSADPGTLSVEVTDRGAGFDPSALPIGRSAGLSGMRERATLLSGTFEVQSGPGGTMVFVQLPCGDRS